MNPDMLELGSKLRTLHSIHLQLISRVHMFTRMRRELESDYERLYGAYGQEWELCKDYCESFEKTYAEHAADCGECYLHFKNLLVAAQNDAEEAPAQTVASVVELFDTSIEISAQARDEADACVRAIRELCYSISELERR